MQLLKDYVNIHTIYSERSGMGKSYTIQNIIKSKDLGSCRIPYHGELTRDKVIGLH
jgi:hypothetical protein